MTAYDHEKDPDAVLDYLWDWGAWLEDGETITNADVSVVGVALVEGKPAPAIVAGETLAGVAVPAGAVLAWLGGGTLRAPASATCRITTSEGRVDERTKRFKIVQR